MLTYGKRHTLKEEVKLKKKEENLGGNLTDVDFLSRFLFAYANN